MHQLFSKELEEKLFAEIDKTLKTLPRPWIAAFDADGTLWDVDLGESFFEYQIKNKLVPLPEDPWGEYEKRKKENMIQGFMWLMHINAGKQIGNLRKWAQACVEEMNPLPIFPSQKKLIEYLHSRGVTVYVVTASIKEAVAPGALKLGIPADFVLGMNTQILNGVVTTKDVTPYTWKEGKAEALLTATQGIKPFLASGNTMGDLALLECASHIKVAVCAHTQNERNYETEIKLQAEAQRRGWFTHRFR